MPSYLTREKPRGVARLRHRVVGFFARLECGCLGGAEIDGNCMDCGAPSLL